MRLPLPNPEELEEMVQEKLKRLKEMAQTMTFEQFEQQHGITKTDTRGCESPYYQLETREEIERRHRKVNAFLEKISARVAA